MKIDDVALYLDMDGVFVDFDKAAEEIVGPELFQMLHKVFHGHISPSDLSKLEHNKMCDIMINTPNFWQDLHWMSDGKELFTYIKSTFKANRIGVATAPLKGDQRCCQGKWEWIQNNFKIIDQRNYFCTTAKWNCVGKMNGTYQVLIDDKLKNIERWRAKGGIGLHHSSTADTIRQIKTLLNSLE